MKRQLLFVILVLALVIMACGFQVDLPDMPTPGPIQTENINVAAPNASGTPVLKLGFGAGEMDINPGSEVLVSGTATYNYDVLKPMVETNGVVVNLRHTGQNAMNNMPSKVENHWDLKLGNMPMDLQIEAGAYKGRFELGGLALSNLTVKDGAADVQINFSRPNQTSMSLLRYETGASNVTIEGIGNASPASLVFKCGAGNYKLDFSGSLQQNLNASIDAGLGNVTLVIPAGIQAQVVVDGGLSNISTGSGWEKTGENTYIQQGSGPAITIMVNIGAGNLTLSR